MFPSFFMMKYFSEPKKENVTLTCSSQDDETLIRVKWFLDGELLKELPECNYKYVLMLNSTMSQS